MNEYTFEKLNLEARNRMKGIVNNDIEMAWEDQNFFDILMGKLPEIRYTNYDSSISDEIRDLYRVYEKYEYKNGDRSHFLKSVETCIDRIKAINPSWYGLDSYYVKEALDIHEFCLISGEGGIGKSYFLYCLEKCLAEKGVPHLCLYGKFEKTCQRIPLEEMLRVCDQEEFVFIFDAVNEMTEQGQLDLYELVKSMAIHENIRIVLSYRLNSMSSTVENQFRELAKHCYSFPGVSFESAMGELTKLAIPDLFRYEDILYSNNALLLNMLCTALSDKEFVKGEKNSIASITFVLEHYVKNSLKKIFKDKLKGSQPLNMWKAMKRVAAWMYEHETKQIDENSLMSVLDDGKLFIEIMKQVRFIECYESDGVMYYIFAIDSLTDYLIARSLFDDISGKSFEEQAEVIKNKTGKLYNVDSAFLIALFDNLTPDYKLISELIKATELGNYFGFEEILKINFQEENIKTFLQVFSPMDPDELFLTFGGYSNKPFNCVNYLNQYYLGNKDRIYELSKRLSGSRILGNIKARLKNIIYFVVMGEKSAVRLDEAFYFAVWSTISPNKDIRVLAQKLLYEVASTDIKYIKILINHYSQFLDPYIQESIVYVLSFMERNNPDITNFFSELISYGTLSAKSICRIAKYFGDDYGYINWERESLYHYDTEATISDEFSRMLNMMDLMNKDYFPFRYWGRDHIDMHTKFLENDKKIISKINKELDKKFQCVKTGDCCGSFGFEKEALKALNFDFVEKTLDMDSFFTSFEKVVRNVFKDFHLSWEDSNKMGEMEFINSSVMKCVDVATGLFYGSLMCNYYVNGFMSYNNFQDSIGYEVYDPLEYGEDFNLAAPVSIFSDTVEKLGDIVVNRLQEPAFKDLKWVNDADLTRKNLLSLLCPISYRNEEWFMIAGRISIHDHEERELLWKDTYDLWCCTNQSETILDDGRARYLTIELDDYDRSITEYRNISNRPWLCKNVKGNADNLFDETTLVLPPADLLTKLGLVPDIKRMVWLNSDGEDIVICNNTKNSYYRDPIGSSIFIRGDYLNKYLEKNTLKFFAFTERFIPQTGYADKTALHFEIDGGTIKKEIPNDGRASTWPTGGNPLCNQCPYDFGVDNSQSYEIALEGIDDLLNKYGI